MRGPAIQHRRPSGEEGYLQQSDLDGNLVVNAGHFGAILATWQESCT